MTKAYLLVLLFAASLPSFSCDCHGTGNTSPFGGFASWQPPSQECIPSHISLNKGEVNYERSSQDVVEEVELDESKPEDVTKQE